MIYEHFAGTNESVLELSDLANIGDDVQGFDTK